MALLQGHRHKGVVLKTVTQVSKLIKTVSRTNFQSRVSEGEEEYFL